MIRVRQVKVEVDNDNDLNIRKILCKKLRCIDSDIVSFSILKKSIDARFKPIIFYNYELLVEVLNENVILNRRNSDILAYMDEAYILPVSGKVKLNKRPLIVGSGPSGLFCAYILAECGYRPIVIERGESIDNRIITVEKFWNAGIINAKSNVQFGEGGAGTFSDGKLNTLVKDKNNRMKKVFSVFVECGANDDIMYVNNPHIGTDVLRDVVRNIRNKIISWGGEFLYNSCLTDLIIKDGKLEQIVINNNKYIDTDVLVLAIGHSARDTFEMLYNRGFNLESKPFAVGVRIQHSQDMINRSQYGDIYCDKLGAASYKLTYKSSDNRGVYSFCMCPGGYVVNASSEEGRIAINGMSYQNRSSGNANSAIVVTVSPMDFGNGFRDGIEFQRKLETCAYNLGDGKIPIQLLKDFYNDVESVKLGSVKPIFKGDYKLSNLNDIFPSYISNSLKEAFRYFGTKIDGFDSDDAIISAVESRTSSPIKIYRDDKFESIISGVYPCGEGCGYAGGITTSSIDGIKVAEAIISKYSSRNLC